MKTSDTSERGLEDLIVTALAGSADAIQPVAEDHPVYGAAGYLLGHSRDYDRAHAVDSKQLFRFIELSQPEVFQQLNLAQEGPARQTFLNRLQGEVAKRGVVDVLRKGIKHGQAHVDLFYGTPSSANLKAKTLYGFNRFSLTRQLMYSPDQNLALDLALFVNGLPVTTFELKNRFTGQTVADAIQQYRRDRDPRELLFQFGRCLAHFAVDDQEVFFCTHLKGNASWFLPFNKGFDDGAGNPPNPEGIKTDYLWKSILSRESLCDILENYAQRVEEINEKTRKKKLQLIFPRYHQLDAVRCLLADVRERGVGKRYLIQHSAGSGKSNSIAWLAHQLVDVERQGNKVFDSVFVITDRRILDKQLRDTLRQFAQVGSIVGAVTQGSAQLRQFITEGKKIIITTVQKFPFVLEAIGNTHKDRHFALLIDEAHSSQGGRTAAKMNMALAGVEDETDSEDLINQLMTSRKMLSNASYFAFTATPKQRTLEIFGERIEGMGDPQFRAFHAYTMKQAIQEGFILDVLQNYTPVESYYRLIKKISDDPEFDTRKAQKKLRRYVESHEHAIGEKARIMLEHFHEQVANRHKLGGQARALIVTSGIERAIQYYHAFKQQLGELRSPYQAIVAFSGEHNYKGLRVDEAKLNGFASKLIPERLQEDPYRFLIVADKFLTGFDEPLLHTMYVDKPLSGIKAVQTLSRLNRAHPQKRDTFVLDFLNDIETIQKSFEPYYRTTVLSGATDPNKLHDLARELDEAQVYTLFQVEELVRLYLEGASRERLDPILDTCAAVYHQDLDEDSQVRFKSQAKAFVRNYNFLSALLPWSLAEWERLSVFLSFLIPKLPAPVETDFSQGVLDAIDMDSYRNEVKQSLNIALNDAEGELELAPPANPGSRPDPEIEHLSQIIATFNDLFGRIEWKDADKISEVISRELPARVAADQAYQNAIQQQDRQNARIEHDRAMMRAIVELLADHSELYNQYTNNPDFKHWLNTTNFQHTYTSQLSSP